jgi:hypothetical protein
MEGSRGTVRHAGDGGQMEHWLSFRPVETKSSALRIEAQLQPGFSGGLLGWKVKCDLSRPQRDKAHCAGGA